MPELSLDELGNPITQSAAIYNPTPLRAPERHDSGGFWHSVLDVGKSAFRGAEEAGHDFYGLIDWAMGDVLPDWNEQRLFKGQFGWGDADTTAGALAQGVSQFLTGFLATGGIAKAAGAGLNLLRGGAAAAEAATAAAGVSKAAEIGKALAKGAVTDFAFFNGHEERLSNLMQHTSLANPITDFLAAREDDGVVLARVKNALEGAGLGLLTEGVFAGLRKMRAGSTVKAAGGSPEEVRAAMAAEGGDNAVSQAVESARVKDYADPGVSSADAKEVSKRIGLNLVEKDDVAAARTVGTVAGTPEDSAFRGNPRKLDALELLDRNMKRNDLNLTPYEGEAGAAVVTRTVEHHYRDAIAKSFGERGGTVTFEQMAQDDLRALADMLRASKSEAGSLEYRAIQGLGQDRNDLIAIASRFRAYRTVMESAAESFHSRVSKIASTRPGGLKAITDDELSGLIAEAHRNAELIRGIKGVSSEFGRGLVGHKIPVAPLSAGMNLADTTAGGLAGQTTKELIEKAGGRDGAIQFLEKTFAAMSDPANRAAGFAANVGLVKKGGVFKMLTEYWINSILSGPMTHVVNATSNAFAAFYRPIEHLVGAGLRLDTTEMYRATKEMQYLVGGFLDAAKLWRKSDVRDAVKDAFLTGESRLLQEGSSALRGGKFGGGVNGPAISASNLGESWLGALGGWFFRPVDRVLGGGLSKAVDIGGAVARTPTRLLQASDSFFKQINFRATAQADLFLQGKTAGLAGEELSRFVADKMQTLIKNGQAYSFRRVYDEGAEIARRALPGELRGNEEAVHRAAAKYAEANYAQSLQGISDRGVGRATEATFTELAGNSPVDRVGKVMQTLTRTVPVTRIFLPFIETPVNILKFAGRRVGLDSIVGVVQTLAGKARSIGLEESSKLSSHFARDMLSGDAGRKADAMGRMAFGVGTALSIANLAGSMFDRDAKVAITGRGPSDPALRESWRNAGFQEYSIKIGNQFYSYQRFDPFATMIGVVADLVQYAHYNEAPQDHITGALAAVVSSIGNNFTNKTYTQGLDNLIELVRAEDQDKMVRIMRSYAGSFVPNVLGQGTRAVDTEIKEVRSFMDAAMAKVPWLADRVEARRNVLGEAERRPQAVGSEAIGPWMNAWMPISTTEVRDDDVLRELANTGHPWKSISPSMSIRGATADLTQFKNGAGQTALDRYRELSGTQKFGGKTVRDAIAAAMKHPGYAKLEDRPEDPSMPNPKAVVLGSIIEGYRKSAKSQLFKEFPALTSYFNDRLKAGR